MKQLQPLLRLQPRPQQQQQSKPSLMSVHERTLWICCDKSLGSSLNPLRGVVVLELGLEPGLELELGLGLGLELRWELQQGQQVPRLQQRVKKMPAVGAHLQTAQ